MRAYLEIDINDERAAFARCEAFVEATDLRYGFTSKVLDKLGGSERARLPELYESDFEWADKGAILVTRPPRRRIVVELFEEDSPLAVENFVKLCKGAGKSGSSGVQLRYHGSQFHRVVKGFVCQGGDIVFGNGSGGESIWGKKFKDDKGGLRLKHDKAGLLSMGNGGKNSNTSQFFFTFAPCKMLDGKHVVFGRIVEDSDDTLAAIEATARESKSDETPSVSVVIADCGVL